MITTQTIMDAMLATATHNIEQNKYNIPDYDNECQAAQEMSDLYLEKFATSISRDISNVNDLTELRTALRTQILGTTYIMRVCLAYLAEVDRHEDAEIDEYLNQSDTETL
ncbi:hypothetical protein N9026_00185 [bacterium]|nr:hypothetical protein [bacterium]